MKTKFFLVITLALLSTGLIFAGGQTDSSGEKILISFPVVGDSVYDYLNEVKNVSEAYNEIEPNVEIELESFTCSGKLMGYYPFPVQWSFFMYTNIKGKDKYISLFVFLFIPTVLIFLFIVYPLINLIYLSFVSWDGIKDIKEFVGFYNFKKFFTEGGVALSSLKNNGLYFLFHLIFIPVEIFLAYQLDKGIRNGNIYKILVLAPYIINGVAVSYMFSSVFSPIIGAVDMTLVAMGFEPSVRWLSDPSVVNYVLVGVSVWRFSGFHIILFYAGLQSIPKELYEAAKIDGAGEIAQFRLSFNLIPLNRD